MNTPRFVGHRSCLALALFMVAMWNVPIAQAQKESSGNRAARTEIQFDTLKPGNSFRDWRRVYFQQDSNTDGAIAYSSGPLDEGVNRFSESNAGYYLPLSSGWSSLVETSHLPNGNGFSEWSMLGQIGTHLGYGWGLEAGLRHSELNPRDFGNRRADANLGMLTVAKVWESYRSQYTLYTSRRENGATTSGHRVALNYLYGTGNSVGLAYDRSWVADNPIALPLGNGPTQSNVGLAGEHYLTRLWSVNYDALFQQGTLEGFKPEIRIGLKLAF